MSKNAINAESCTIESACFLLLKDIVGHSRRPRDRGRAARSKMSSGPTAAALTQPWPPSHATFCAMFCALTEAFVRVIARTMAQNCRYRVSVILSYRACNNSKFCVFYSTKHRAFRLMAKRASFLFFAPVQTILPEPKNNAVVLGYFKR